MFDLMENNNEVALLYGSMLKECLRRSQVATMHVLQSQQYMSKFLEYVTLPNYTFASHAGGMLELLLTRHTSTVAEFLTNNYEWFFDDFNSKLLVSSNQITKAQGLSLMGHVLSEGKNHDLMLRYVSNVENLKLVMNALREGKRVQMKAFRVFKLFVENRDKAMGVTNILRMNTRKLLEILAGLKATGEDQEFDEDKAQISRELNSLKDTHHSIRLPTKE
ncbi:hypothetical protein RIF29_36520 [Crotalaria pallida]|uniref:Uncharacterized protein n=1 Tax=Crotalaria pallida TaxID=3830 RepID=A0AAN9EBK7_CROPI